MKWKRWGIENPAELQIEKVGNFQSIMLKNLLKHISFVLSL